MKPSDDQGSAARRPTLADSRAGDVTTAELEALMYSRAPRAATQEERVYRDLACGLLMERWESIDASEDE